MAGPVDIRLLRYASGVRKELIAYVAISSITAILVIAQAFTLGDVIPQVFLRGADLYTVRIPLVLLGIIVIGRVCVAGLGDVIATRAAVTTSSQLRTALLAQVTRLGPVWLSAERKTHVATLATRGVESIEPYVSRYLPSLIIAIVVPLTAGFAILTQDLLAAVIVAFTAPLIPVFMILIGKSPALDANINAITRRVKIVTWYANPAALGVKKISSSFDSFSEKKGVTNKIKQMTSNKINSGNIFNRSIACIRIPVL